MESEASAVQFVREFAKLGLTRSVGGVLALALARELTPVVTCIILAGRVGSAFAAELGTMAVSNHPCNMYGYLRIHLNSVWASKSLVYSGIGANGFVTNAWVGSY